MKPYCSYKQDYVPPCPKDCPMRMVVQVCPLIDRRSNVDKALELEKKTK